MKHSIVQNERDFLYDKSFYKRWRPQEVELKLLLLLCDFFLLSLGIIGGLVLRALLGQFFSCLLPCFDLWVQGQAILYNFWLFLPIIFVFLAHRLYRRLPFWEEVRSLLEALLEGFLFVFALVAIAKLSDEVSRLVIFSAFLLCCFLFPVGRYFFKRFLFSLSRYRVPALIWPANREAARLVQAIEQEPTFGYEVLGFLDDNPQRFGRSLAGKKIFGSLRQIGKFTRLRGVDAVFILLNGGPSSRLSQIYAYLQRQVGEIFLVPAFVALGLFNAQLSFLWTQRQAVIRINNPLNSYLNRATKRVVDLVGASLFLIFSFPLMILIALLIKIDSAGPIIFTQERVGMGGKRFRIYKFRTMFTDSETRLEEFFAQNPKKRQEWLKYRKLEGDPRITKVGRFLRRFSLDELPQLFNVLRGEMSLVGPRPITAEELQFYGEERYFYLAVRPGLTGLWQVSGRNALSFAERVKLDSWYVQNWSLWLDFFILWRTIPALTNGV